MTDHPSPANAELLPCPFCGGNPENTEYYGSYNKASWCVHCASCDVSLNGDATPEEAATRWNTRPLIRAQPAASPVNAVTLLARARQFVADSGCDEDDGDVNAARDELLAEMDAALRIRAQQMGEPATYQWRFQYGNGEWSKWQNVTSPWDGKRNPDWEYRPLYAFTSPERGQP